MKHLFKRSIAMLLMLAMLLSIAPLAVFAAEDAQFVVLSTTDMHGRCWDTNILNDTAMNNSMLNVATAVAKVRESYGESVVLVDNGDTYQGTPVSTYQISQFTSGATTDPNPMAISLQYIGYDLANLGNHEFNYTWNTMEATYDYLSMDGDGLKGLPTVCANLYYDGTDGVHAAGENVMAPYIVKNLKDSNGNDVKVAIICFVTPDCTRWDVPDNYPGMRFSHPDNPNLSIRWEAEKYLQIVEENENPDFVIVAFHSGLGGTTAYADDELTYGVNTENQVYSMIAGTTGIDMVIAGHDHSEGYSNNTYKNANGEDVLVVNGGGNCLTTSVFSVAADGTISLVSSKNDKLSNYKADAGLKELLAPYADAASGYVNATCGKAIGNWNKVSKFYLQQSDTMDLIGRAQMAQGSVHLAEKYDTESEVAELYAATGLDHLTVDLSSTSVVVNGTYNVSAGDLSMKDIYRMYKYDNSLYLLPVSGAEIKDILEFNAATHLKVNTSSGTPIFSTTGDDFTNPIFYGIDFKYDLSREEYDRITGLKFANGDEVIDEKIYILAVNNYHLGNASGPFAHYSTEDAIWSQTDDMGGGFVQDLIAEFLAAETAAKGGVSPAPSNWEIVYTGEIIVGEAEGEYIGDLVDPSTLKTDDQVMIYYPAGGTLISNSASGSKLAPSEDVTTGQTEGGVRQAGTNSTGNLFTIVKNEDGSVSFVDANGKYLTSGATGNSLTLADAASEYANWLFEETDGGYFIKNQSAQYNGKAQYIEFYGGAFTMYGMGTNPAIYIYQLYKLPVAVDTPCEHDWDEGTVTTAPTCTEDGEKTFTCTLCGETKTEPIEASDHNYENGACTVCGKIDPSTVEGSTFVRVNELQEGDEIIIVCNAKNIALGAEYGTSFYNPGVPVNPVDDKIITDDASIVWTVGKEGDFYTFSYNGQKIAMGTGYTSMPLGEVNYKWQITPAQNEGTFYVANLDRDPSQTYYMQWYEAKNYWSAYYKLDDTLMALSFYKKDTQPESNGDDAVILFTNDVHTYIGNEGLRYSNVAALKQDIAATGTDVILLDAGDHIQGTAYGSMDKGETIIKLMNAANYDAATLGNHEFDYGMARMLELVGMAEYPYISTNFFHLEDGVRGEAVLPNACQFNLGGKKVVVIGITTPESFTKSTPAYFMDENGNYIYDIAGGDDGADLYRSVQEYVTALKMSIEPDYIIALGHLGDDPSSSPWTSEELIANVSGLDAFIDGHSHSTVERKEVLDKDGNTVILTQTGEYLNAIGKMTITAEGEIDVELITEYANADEEVKAIEDAWIAEVDELLGEIIATSYVDFRIKDDNGTRLIRSQETNLGDFCADALYYLFDVTEGLGVDVAIMNGGGIRADMAPGEISYKTTKTVHTFGNVACLIEVTGQQILDALEWGAKNVGTGENGGFLQVAGVTYEIHSYIPSTVQADDKGVWAGAPTGEYRVKNVTVGGEPLDVEKTYKMAGYNYTLRDLGDGFAMFDGAVNVKDYVMEDYMVLANYAKSFPEGEIKAFNSPLGSDYSNIYGEGRITIVEEQPVKDFTILFTNDIHTYIANEGLRYSNVAALKQEIMMNGTDVILVDAGDHIQGTAYGSMDKGETIIELMNAAGYDLATLGNHEFDYGMARALELVGKANYPYVSANFYNEKDGVRGENVLDSYQIFSLGGKLVALVGLTTPETFTKSTPAYFMDENGNYIYGIAGGDDGADLYADAQAAIDAARAQGADYVIALGHLGDDPASMPWTSEELIANVTGLDAFIDGHSHSTVERKEVADKEGNTVILTQTGEYLNAIGKMTISVEGEISVELIGEYTEAGATVKAIEDAWIAEVDELLGEIIAKNEVDFRIKDDNGTRLIRSQETNLGDFTADALYYLFDVTEGLGVDAAIMNGGGIRADMPVGDVSYKTTKTVHTFGNVACLIEVTGQQILDALEWGAKNVGVGENGGFLQVSGVTYEIHSYIPSTVQADDKGVWAGAPTGEYRVKNVTIGGEPLDVTKTYKLAGYNYTLRDLGDGFAMFDGAVNVKDYVMEDYMVLANYAKSFPEATIKADNSVLGANYGDMNGEGRITIVEKIEEPFVNPYTDVAEDAWYYDYIMEATKLGLVNGVKADLFKPDANLTRAQFATILYRAMGSPSVEGLENPYTDLVDDWYKDAVIYLSSIGVVNGTGGGKFAPAKNITREQMVTMLYRAAGITVTDGYEVLDKFEDKDSISTYAVDPMVWAINAGLVNGVKENILKPQGNATRAQATKVILLFAQWQAQYPGNIIQ